MKTSLDVAAVFVDRLSCAALYDASGGRAHHVDIRAECRTRAHRFAGPVVPVATGNDMLPGLQALHVARPGEVLYVRNEGPGNDALAGDIFLSAAREQKVAALVVEGAVRDLDECENFGVPVYSTDVTFVSAKTAVEPARDVPVPLEMQGFALEPGMWLFGDRDGLVAVSAEDVGAVIKAALLLAERERELRSQILGGDVRLTDLIGLEDYLAGRGDLTFEV